MTDFHDRLHALASAITFPDLWRPVAEVEQILETGEVAGTGDPNTPDFLQVDLRDKEILDLGCNVGYYAFLALRHGARRVVGEDIVPEALEIARLYTEKYQPGDAAFRQASFYDAADADQFPMVLFMDIIGNNSVREGRAVAQFDAAVSRVAEELVISLRPVFIPERHMTNLAGGLPEDPASTWADLERFYGPRYCREGRFHFLEWAKDRVGPGWEFTPLPEPAMAHSIRKQVFHVRRHGPHA